MPYTEIRKEKVDGKDKWCFHKKSTGERVCADTYEKAVAAMRARYVHEKEMERCACEDEKRERRYLDPATNPLIRAGGEGRK